METSFQTRHSSVFQPLFHIGYSFVLLAGKICRYNLFERRSSGRGERSSAVFLAGISFATRRRSTASTGRPAGEKSFSLFRFKLVSNLRQMRLWQWTAATMARAVTRPARTQTPASNVCSPLARVPHLFISRSNIASCFYCLSFSHLR